MAEKSSQNVERLAQDVVDGMDMDAVVSYAVQQMESYFQGLSPEEFEEEWTRHFGED